MDNLLLHTKQAQQPKDDHVNMSAERVCMANSTDRLPVNHAVVRIAKHGSMEMKVWIIIIGLNNTRQRNHRSPVERHEALW